MTRQAFLAQMPDPLSHLAPLGFSSFHPPRAFLSFSFHPARAFFSLFLSFSLSLFSPPFLSFRLSSVSLSLVL